MYESLPFRANYQFMIPNLNIPVRVLLNFSFGSVNCTSKNLGFFVLGANLISRCMLGFNLIICCISSLKMKIFVFFFFGLWVILKMTGDRCSLVSKETRLALCDMTNVPSKRAISSILGDFLLKSGDDSGKIVAREGSGVKFSKRLCLVVDDLVKESTRTSDTNDGSSSDDKNSFGDSENFDVKESQGETDAVDIGLGAQHLKVEDGDAVVELSQNKDSNMTDFASQTDGTTGEDLTVTVVSSSNSESDDRLAMAATEGTGLLPDSQTIKSFSINRCSTVESMGIVNHDMDADDELKSCSCSFCLKGLSDFIVLL